MKRAPTKAPSVQPPPAKRARQEAAAAAAGAGGAPVAVIDLDSDGEEEVLQDPKVSHLPKAAAPGLEEEGAPVPTKAEKPAPQHSEAVAALLQPVAPIPLKAEAAASSSAAAAASSGAAVAALAGPPAPAPARANLAGFVSAFAAPKKAVDVIKTGASRCYVIDNWLDPREAAAALVACKALPLDHNPPCLGGVMRRSVGFFSDDAAGYGYAGQTSGAKGGLSTHPILADLTARVNAQLGTAYNGVLVNAYHTGDDTIGKHSDKTGGLSRNNHMVACVSLGASRTFRIQPIVAGGPKADVATRPGQLLVMEGDFQKEFTHEVPAQKKVRDLRISLTFREHVSGSGGGGVARGGGKKK